MEKEVYECSIEQLDEMIQEQIEKQKAQKQENGRRVAGENGSQVNDQNEERNENDETQQEVISHSIQAKGRQMADGEKANGDKQGKFVFYSYYSSIF